jgi:hypothetical protein
MRSEESHHTMSLQFPEKRLHEFLNSKEGLLFCENLSWGAVEGMDFTQVSVEINL